ncbi:hypothetical protein ACQY0O_002491 [Thecaphora frezii]
MFTTTTLLRFAVTAFVLGSAGAMVATSKSHYKVAQVTFYTPKGPAACKAHVAQNEMGVAVSQRYGQWACGKTVKYFVDEKPHTATVVDFNTRAEEVLDLTQSQYQATIPKHYGGSVRNVKFQFLP